MTNIRSAKVISNEKISSSVNKIGLKITGNFNYKPGQFIMVMSGTNRKPYSIASSPFEKDIELCIKRAGQFSNYMCDLKIGSKVKVSGPNGNFLLKNSNKKELIFVATGTGIAPIKSMISTLIHNKDKRKISLYFGVRKKSDILYYKLFKELENKNNNFTFVPCLSRASNSWKGERGHVDEVLKKKVKNAKDKEIYLCGLSAMVKGVKDLAEKIGFKKEQINFERYV